jgi:hypothetical protein
MPASKLCGARSKHDWTKRCRHPGTGAGGRCYLHGGRSPGYHGPINYGPAHAAARSKQALYKAWGLRWAPHRGKKTPVQRAEILIVAIDKAIIEADQALVTITAPDLSKPDELKSPGELLSEGLWEGLVLGRDICRQVRSHVTKTIEAGLLIDGHDLKVMGLGSTTAGWLTRAGIRIAEGEFRAKRDDVLAGLLAQIALAKGDIEKK